MAHIRDPNAITINVLFTIDIVSTLLSLKFTIVFSVLCINPRQQIIGPSHQEYFFSNTQHPDDCIISTLHLPSQSNNIIVCLYILNQTKNL